MTDIHTIKNALRSEVFNFGQSSRQVSWQGSVEVSWQTSVQMSY